MTRATRVGGRARMVDFDALRAAVTVAAVLAAHGLALRRDGRLPCPLCDASNSSTFSVYAEGRRWRCWRCGAHGDALDLERQLSSCDLPAAADRLATLAGLSGTPTAAPVDVRRLERRRQREKRLRQWAALRCRDALDAVRTFDACAHRLSVTGRLETAATGTPSDATLDALGHIYRLRDRAECDVELFADADLGAVADIYFEGQR